MMGGGWWVVGCEWWVVSGWSWEVGGGWWEPHEFWNFSFLVRRGVLVVWIGRCGASVTCGDVHRASHNYSDHFFVPKKNFFFAGVAFFCE